MSGIASDRFAERLGRGSRYGTRARPGLAGQFSDRDQSRGAPPHRRRLARPTWSVRELSELEGDVSLAGLALGLADRVAVTAGLIVVTAGCTTDQVLDLLEVDARQTLDDVAPN